MNLLAAGAGASEGMDTYLQRMMEEEKLKQLAAATASQQAETGRHNLAEEDLQSRDHQLRSMDTQSRIRMDQTNHDTAAADRENGLLLKKISLRPIGATVTPEEHTSEMAGGVPSGNYGDEQPPSMGKSTPEGEVGPSAQGFPWKGTQDQITKAKQAGKHGEDKGTVHDTEHGLMRLFANGDTEPVLDNAGQPVKGYHTPPSADKVMIQMGNEWVPRAEAQKRFAAGDATPLPETSATRTMEEGARMLQPHIKRLEQTAATLDQQGLFGPVMSRVRTLMTKAGTLGDFQTAVANDPELNKDRIAGQFATSLGLLATGAGRVHGGARGGGSPQMYEHFKQMLSDAGSYNMFVGRLDSLDEYMGGYAAGPSAAPKKGGDVGKPDLIFDPATGTFKKP